MHAVDLPQGASAATDVARPLIVIQPSRGWMAFKLREVWQYRELLGFLVWRDVKVRYKQTALGTAWAILQPLLTMAIFSAIFGGFARLPSDGLPYPVFTFAALLPWTYFSQAIARSGMSLVGSANLISKVYFPRLIVPIAAALAPIVDFGIAFVILVGMMAWFGIVPTWGVLLLPLLLLLAFVSALAIGLWLAALNVKYRDVTHMIPFLVQIWMYASPIAYSASLVPERWRLLYGLNPMTGVIEGFRWALLGKVHPDWNVIALSTIVIVALLIGGLAYFKRVERTFADVV